MIVACHACPSQYSVPDAKLRGKKVRITCKHCGASIIVDGMHLPDAPEVSPSALPKVHPLPSLDGPSASRQDDVTLIARPKFGQGLSVHDEPTVIGQIPREALDFERAFSQRTSPPPDGGAPTAATPAAEAPLARIGSARPAALPEAPESPNDATKRASPRALALSEPPIAPQLSPSALPSPLPARPSPIPTRQSPVPVLRTPIPTVVVKSGRDEPTLVSSSLPRVLSQRPAPPVTRSHLARVALMLLALLVVAFAILKLR